MFFCEKYTCRWDSRAFRVEKNSAKNLPCGGLLTDMKFMDTTIEYVFLKRHSWTRQSWMAICHSLLTERLPALITVAMLCPDSQVYFSSVFL